MDPIPDDLRPRLRALMDERGTNGLALCAFDRTRIRFAGGVGTADLRRDEPVDSRTVFRVASISKLLTTTLVLRLVERGDLDLDASVNDLLPPELALPGVDGPRAEIPLRTLLSHTSGLGCGIRGALPGNPVVAYIANQGRVRNLTDAISGLRPVRAAHERIVYSNPAFNVAGYVAGAALGTDFESAAREHVFAPLGLGDSDFGPRRFGPGVATPYGAVVPPGVGPKPADRMRLVATPMGGLTTTVEDLARFGRMVLNGGELDGRRILGEDTVREATSMAAMNHPGLGQGYGLGFKVRPWRGRTVVGHDGNMPGVATQLALSLDDGVGVVALTNGFALGVPHQAVSLALEHLLDLPPLDVPRPTEATPEDDRNRRVAEAHDAAGTYRLCDASPPGLVGRFDDLRRRVVLTAEADGVLRVEGYPGSDGTMWLHPGTEPGRYRAVARVDDGTGAVVEHLADGTHVWLGHTTHLHRRARAATR